MCIAASVAPSAAFSNVQWKAKSSVRHSTARQVPLPGSSRACVYWPSGSEISSAAAPSTTASTTSAKGSNVRAPPAGPAPCTAKRVAGESPE